MHQPDAADTLEGGGGSKPKCCLADTLKGIGRKVETESCKILEIINKLRKFFSCTNILEYSSNTPKCIPYDNRKAYFDDLTRVIYVIKQLIKYYISKLGSGGQDLC